MQKLVNQGAVEETKLEDVKGVASIVFVPKGENKIDRPCINPKIVNELSAHEQTMITSVASVFLRHFKYACTLDLKDGFFSVKLSEEFSKYFCFVVDGHYKRFKRLPQGSSLSASIFS